jgi:hypothetical protein
LGFVATGFSGLTSMNGPLLLGIFMINPLHNIWLLSRSARGLMRPWVRCICLSLWRD